MENKLILPPNYIETPNPVIFLAGPITGAPEWQDVAIKYLLTNVPNLLIASPRRKLSDKVEFQADNTITLDKSADFTGATFTEQVDWETHYLNRASQNGAILFWLAKEAFTHPERAYAQTTRFELAEWKTKYQQRKFNLIVGIEEGFTGARYMQRRFAQDCPEIQIFNSLEVMLKHVATIF